MEREHAWWTTYRKPQGFPAARYWQGCGVTLAWNEFGDPGGFPVVFCHGWPSSRWQAQVVDAQARIRGFRILSIDRPGMGCSPWIPGRSIDQWPVWVEAFLDSLDVGSFAQLAVSGGGPYAIACAALLADRVTATSILCGAVPLPPESVARLHPAYRMLAGLSRLPGPVFSPGLRLAAVVMKGNPDHPPLAWLAGMLPEPDASLLTSCPDLFSSLMTASSEGLKQRGRAVMDDGRIYLAPWTIDLATIRQPVRCWHGGLDRTVPLELAETFLKRVPAANLTVVPGDGHFSLAIHRTEAASDALGSLSDPANISPECSGR